MNYEKIPFNIKYRPEIESGEVRVITRIGQSVGMRFLLKTRRRLSLNYSTNSISALVELYV